MNCRAVNSYSKKDWQVVMRRIAAFWWRHLFCQDLPNWCPWIVCKNNWVFCLSFSDNGISVLLMTYQVCAEIFVYLLVVVFLVILPVEKDMFMVRIIGVLNTFVIFVIQPLFYLNGDVNFRNKVLHKGLWFAIKTELFWMPRTVSCSNWSQIILRSKFLCHLFYLPKAWTSKYT